MEDPEKLTKKKDQIRLNEELSFRLQAEKEEEVRLAREKAKKEQEANVALTEEWNDIQEKIEADQEKKKALCSKKGRRKEEQITYQSSIKEHHVYLSEEHGRKEESSSKRAGDELEQEKIKKQKIDEDKETVELQSLMEVIPDEEEVAVDAIPLATKPPSIMLKSFDKEDLETLWKLVKAKHGSTRPEEGYEIVLWSTFYEVAIYAYLYAGGKEGRTVGIKRLLDVLEVIAAK
ncbi:hypothetical protein Tco_0757775 [Tanacetum coccineum]